MKGIKKIESEIVEEFNMFSDWTEKYEYLIDLGKELIPLDSQYKIEENLIKGCQSRVWIHVKKENEKIIYNGDSDAIITRGIVAILIRVFSHQPAKEIIDADLEFINKIGLTEHLSPTRSNGLTAMIKQMKLYAIALNRK